MMELAGKSVLVTGATGLIGSNLVERLLSMGDVKVFAVGRNMVKMEKVFVRYRSNEKLILLEYDITRGVPQVKEKVDVIFHAAGVISGKSIQEMPVDAILPNYDGLKNCFNFALKQKNTRGKGCKVIVFSSVTVYDNLCHYGKSVTESETGMTCQLEPPKAAYAESKRMAEVLSYAYHRQYDIDVVIARFSTVYGYTQVSPESAFYEFIKKACRGEDIMINASFLRTRDNIYVDDAVDGLLTIVCKGKSGEAYNISSNGELENEAAIDTIAKIISRAAPCKMTVQYADSDITIEKGYLLDNTKLKQLGWNIHYSLEEGIAATMKKYYEESNTMNG